MCSSLYQLITVKVTELDFSVVCLVMSDSCDPIDCRLPSSCVHRILQAIIQECIAIFFLQGSFQPRNPTPVSCIADRLYWSSYMCYINVLLVFFFFLNHSELLCPWLIYLIQKMTCSPCEGEKIREYMENNNNWLNHPSP